MFQNPTQNKGDANLIREGTSSWIMLEESRTASELETKERNLKLKINS